jgi:DNA-binding CsgD family transcriptional regulator/ArsR family metal-binding transcriptional regulator
MRIKGYSEFSLSKSGVKSHTSPNTWWGAYFKLDANVRDLFPFINAVNKNAKLYDVPQHIQFLHEGARCTLYPREVIAAAFGDENQARRFADSLVQLLNDLDEKKTSILPEYQPYRVVSPVNIYKLLPKTNCRECGFLSCIAFAAALGRGMVSPEQCPGFAAPLYSQSIYPVYDADGNIRATFSIGGPPSIQPAPAQQEKEMNPYQSNQTKLTKREIQVLRLVARGATNTDISERLAISPHTVKSHVIHIFNKLNVNDRTQAAVWATQQKII